MAEKQNTLEAVQDLLRTEFEHFGDEMKQVLHRAIHEEMQGKSVPTRRSSLRNSLPRATNRSSVLGQVKTMQAALRASEGDSDVETPAETKKHERFKSTNRLTFTAKESLFTELDSVLNEQSMPFLGIAKMQSTEVEEASDMFLLPYMRGLRTSPEYYEKAQVQNPMRSPRSDGAVTERIPDLQELQSLKPALNPASNSISASMPSPGRFPAWRGMPRRGHTDNYRQLELVQERVDSSHHENLLAAFEEDLFGQEDPTGRGTIVNSRTKSDAAKSMRLQSRVWQTEEEFAIWSTKHRRGAEFEDQSSDFDSGYRTTWKLMTECVHGSLWSRVTGAMVVLNAITIGVQADYMAVNWAEGGPAIFPFLEKFFCVFFVLELSLRAFVLGLSEFFCKPGYWHYNWFDLVMVALQVTETLHTSPPMFDMAMTHLSTFRMLRLLRIIRLARILHLVSELRMLIVSISHSVRNLGWVVVLLLLMIYVFAVYLTQIVTDYKVLHKDSFEDEAEHYRILQEYYGSVDRSMLSLYAMVSEGVHWRELSDPLAEHISPWMPLLFFFFSAFALLAVMNVVTGVFVESAINTALEDKKVTIASQMLNLFRQFDEDSDGMVTWEEFHSQLHSAEMQLCLKEVDVQPEDAEELFRLLDIDRSGTIDVEELVHGSMRLMGYAKAIDLATFMHEYRLNSMRWASHARCVEGCLVALLSEMEPAEEPEDDIGESTRRSDMTQSQISFLSET